MQPRQFTGQATHVSTPLTVPQNWFAVQAGEQVGVDEGGRTPSIPTVLRRPPVEVMPDIEAVAVTLPSSAALISAAVAVGQRAL